MMGTLNGNEHTLAAHLAEQYQLDPAEAEALRLYLASAFQGKAAPDTLGGGQRQAGTSCAAVGTSASLPVASSGEEFLAPWREWISQIPSMEAAEILNRCVVPRRPVQFAAPGSVRLEIYPSTAGEIPIITLGDDRDFEEFVTNLVYKGERPEGISKMGASFIYGEKQRFIVLSEKPYSNVPARWMGLEEGEWRKKSMVLRREHECTHYYTRRYYGGTQNHLSDELMADFFGLYAAFGRYEARWFKHFMGVDETPCSLEGRLTLYTAGLSPKVQSAVEEAARLCSDALEAWSKSDAFKCLTAQERIERLWNFNLKIFSGLAAWDSVMC